MLGAVIIAAIFACAYGAPFGTDQVPIRLVPMLDGRIVGGQPVDIVQFPWQVTMQYFGSHRCGGSVVLPHHIVTAAHCTEGTQASNHAIRGGSSIHHSGGQLIQVGRIYIHPQYNSWTLNFDVSTMTLQSSFNTDAPTIAAIRLPDQDEQVQVGAYAQVTGWGALWEGGPGPEQLQAVSVPVLSNAQCNIAYPGEITPQMICAGVPEGGLDACQGDSGGPMVVGNTLVGIVSWGYGCARPGFPGVYSRVSAFRTWIDSTNGTFT